MTDATVSCPKCATEVPSGTLLCANCGHTMGGTDTDTPARPARTSATERTLALRANIPVQQPKGKQKQKQQAPSPADEAAERARQEAEAARLEVEKAKKEAERIAAERAKAEKAAAKEAARLAAEQAKAAKKSERAARDAADRAASAGSTTAPTTDDPADTSSRRRASATDRVNALRAPTDDTAAARPAKPAKPPKAPKPPKQAKAPKPARSSDRDEQRPTSVAANRRRPAGASNSTRLLGAAAVLAIFVVAGAGVAVLRGADSGADGPSSGFGVEPTDVVMPELPLESSRYADIIEGSGEPADVGDTLTVDYVYFTSSTGEQVDSSFRRDEPWTFVLGVGEVIPGLDRGLIGVKAGGRRQIDIVPELAYGDTGVEGVIGADETLTFVIDVVSIVDGPPPTDPTTTTSTTMPPDPDETALAGLSVEIAQDREVAATLTGNWVLQLAVEYVGLEVDGTTLDAPTIFATFQDRLADYPVLMLDAAQWQFDTTTDAPGIVYVTVVGLPFATRTEARAWAENNGIESDAYELVDFPEPVA